MTNRYATLGAVSKPALLAGAGLLGLNLAIHASAPDIVGQVIWLWSGLLLLASAWHRLPPAFAAPDLYRRIARSIDPLEPASEWDEGVLRATRFALAVAATWVLVANDLVRDTKIRFLDSAAHDASKPQLELIRRATTSTDFLWGNVSLLVLVVAIAVGIGRRLHAVDATCYRACEPLRRRAQPGPFWYIVLAAAGITVIIATLYVTTSLLT